MANNYLQLNDNKTEVIIFGTPNVTEQVASNLGTLSPNIHQHAGIIFD